MDATCFGEDYNTKFDSESFLKTYFSKPGGCDSEGFLPTVLEELHNICNGLGAIQSGRMLEFGPGPCIHTALSASKVFQHITFAEYAECNRNAIQKWIKNEEDAHDWMSIMTYVGHLEGISGKEVEERTREVIEEVLPCDVHQPYPLGQNKREPYDLVVSSLCLEAACKSKESYNQAVKNMSKLIKTNGHLVLIGILGQTFYKVGCENFFSLSLTKEDIQKAVISAGMEILKLNVGVYKPKGTARVSDYDAYVILHAKTSV